MGKRFSFIVTGKVGFGFRVPGKVVLNVSSIGRVSVTVTGLWLLGGLIVVIGRISVRHSVKVTVRVKLVLQRGLIVEVIGRVSFTGRISVRHSVRATVKVRLVLQGGL